MFILSLKAKSPAFMQPTAKFPAHFRSFGCSDDQVVDTDVESPEEAGKFRFRV